MIPPPLKKNLALAAFALAWCLAATVALTRARGAFLADFGPVPDFRLTDHSGRAVTNADLRGRVWVADFIFTRCAGQCPVMTSQMKGLARRLAGATLVSFTLDPEDTPAVLERYRREQGADWLFLTGKPGEVRALSVKGFRLAAAAGGDAKEPIVHSSKLVLVDAEGRIRGYYDGADDASLAELAGKAARLPNLYHRPMNGRLPPCPGTPNCVAERFAFTGDPAAAWDRLKAALKTQRRLDVVEEKDGYLRAVATSALLGFKDDVEFLMIPAENAIDVRSASRLGKYDFGVNRRRVEALRRAFAP